MKKLIIASAIILAMATATWASPCHIKSASGNFILSASGDKIHSADNTCTDSALTGLPAIIRLLIMGVF